MKNLKNTLLFAAGMIAGIEIASYAILHAEVNKELGIADKDDREFLDFLETRKDKIASKKR